MNRRTILTILTVLTTLGTLSAHASYILPGSGAGTRNTEWAYYWSDFNTGWRDLSTTYFFGPWARDAHSGWPTNATTGGGAATFQRGGESDLTIYLNHDVGQGRFYSATIASYAAMTTSIISSEDGHLKGYSPDMRWAKKADNAVTVGGYDGGAGAWSFTRGTFEGGVGRNGIYMRNSPGFTSYGATFIGGTGIAGDPMPSGAIMDTGVGTVTIGNDTNTQSVSTFKGADITGGVVSGGGLYQETASFKSADGLTATASSITIEDGVFSGSRPINGSSAEQTINYTGDDTFGATIHASGGSGAWLSSAAISIDGGSFQGGDASVLTLGGPNAFANAVGGNGLVLNGGANAQISNVTATAGSSKPATIVTGAYYEDINNPGNSRVESDSAGEAFAHGGSGIFARSGTYTISDAIAVGSIGSAAIANKTNGMAIAHGGNGVTAMTGTDVTINSGTFTGAKGGSANAADSQANGGSGVYISGGTLTVNGGTFNGAKAGKAKGQTVAMALEGRGLFAIDSDVTVAGGTFDNGIYINNSSAQLLTISGGIFNGDVDIEGGGTTALTLNNSTATLNGSMNLNGGTLDVGMNSASDAEFFTAFSVNDATANFSGSAFTSGTNSSITLNGASSIGFTDALNLSTGSSVNLGSQGTLVASNNITIGNSALINIGVDFLAATNGFMEVTGNLDGSATGARIVAAGTAITPSGSVRIANIGGSLNQGGNTNLIKADFGWLTKNSNTNTTGGIEIDYVYNELGNTLTGIPANTLTNFDAMLQDTNNLSYFAALNSIGGESGASSIRFASSQASDVVNASMKAPGKISEQLANRGTDFRAANKFASNKPLKMQGAAGPEEGLGLTGWIKTYGAHSSRDKDTSSLHDSYDATTYGTIIGIDKSFNNLLIGIAGGYASSDLDAGSTYSASMDTWHGSIFTTISGEALYLDLSATYADNDVEESSPIMANGSYKSSTASGYIGAGWKIDVAKIISITPNASMLATHYEQEEYTRQIMNSGGMVLGEYDEWSYLGSIGAKIAAAKQLNWDNIGFGFIPEFRLNWLHEFNADVDDITMVGGGPILVRAREEDMVKVGFGMDMWNWRFQNTMFEVDIDGILGDTSSSITVSGKLSYNF